MTKAVTSNVMVALLIGGASSMALSGSVPRSARGSDQGEEKLNTRLVGAHDLQARSAYQPLPVAQGHRRILYVGHHAGEALNPLTGVVEASGTSILDVTDPATPTYLHHIPPTGDAQGAQMVQVCSGRQLPKGDPEKTYLLRANGNQSHELWDVSDPERPRLLDTVTEMGRTPSGIQNTHKNWWECDTGIAYLIGSLDGWRSQRILQIFDLSDPIRPQRVRNFGLAGMQPGSSGRVPGGNGIHEPVVLGNRLYIAYGPSRDGVLQIVDREKLLQGDPGSPEPFAPTAENFRYPEIGRLDLPHYWGGHTALPMLGMDITEYADNTELQTRDFVVMTSESGVYECQESPHVLFVIDITDETRPVPVATFQVPASLGDFCNRGGRFGPHAPQWFMGPRFHGKLVFVSWFNAGARVIDARDPFNPREVGFYIPATTNNTRELCITVDGEESCKRAIQTNNLEADDRGLIYLVDRAGTGLHIIELTGAAAQIVAVGGSPRPLPSSVP